MLRMRGNTLKTAAWCHAVGHIEANVGLPWTRVIFIHLQECRSSYQHCNHFTEGKNDEHLVEPTTSLLSERTVWSIPPRGPGSASESCHGSYRFADPKKGAVAWDWCVFKSTHYLGMMHTEPAVPLTAKHTLRLAIVSAQK